MFEAIGSKKAESISNSINVSSYGRYPYNLFSPFTYSPDFLIPVPGQDQIYAQSVESIWQGLKIIDGITDFLLFHKRPKKRKGKVFGHLFGNDELGIIEAREKIYKPAYLFYLEEIVSEDVKDSLLLEGLKNGNVRLYDVEENLDIMSPKPLAHSVFLCRYMNDYLHRRLNDTKTKIDKEYNREDHEGETLAAPVCRAIKFYQSSSEINRGLIRYFLIYNQNVRDIYHARYYVELFERLERL